MSRAPHTALHHSESGTTSQAVLWHGLPHAFNATCRQATSGAPPCPLPACMGRSGTPATQPVWVAVTYTCHSFGVTRPQDTATLHRATPWCDVLRPATLCCDVLHHAARCCNMLCGAVICYTCGAVICRAVLCHDPPCTVGLHPPHRNTPCGGECWEGV